MPGKPRSGHSFWGRWRDRLTGSSTTRAAEEREEKTTSTTQGDDPAPAPPPSLDNVLRDAARRRDANDDGEAGPGGPTGG